MSTVSTASSATYDMWARFPPEDEGVPKAGDNFKLTERRVPQNTGRALALPMAHIWQGAVQFDETQRQRQLTAELNTRQAKQQTLMTAAGLTTGAAEASKALTVWAMGTNSSLAATPNRQADFFRSPSSSEAQAPVWGYSAQGKWAKPVSNNPTPLGMLLDITV